MQALPYEQTLRRPGRAHVNHSLPFSFPCSQHMSDVWSVAKRLSVLIYRIKFVKFQA